MGGPMVSVTSAAEVGPMVTSKSSVNSTSGISRGRPPISKDRELDVQGGHLLSPLTSRAASPVISPLQAPALPPGVDELIEFSLDGPEGEFGLLDDLAGDEGAIEFKLNGIDGLGPSPSNTP